MKYIYGQEDLKIEAEIKKLTSNFEGEVIVFNNDEPTEDILLAVETSSFFSERKIIIIKNHFSFLEAEAGKRMIYITSNSPKENLIVIVNSLEKNVSLNPFIKFLHNNATCIKCDKITDKEMPGVILSLVEQKGGKISLVNATKIAQMLPNDLGVIVNEISALVSYNPEVTSVNIELMMSKFSEDDFFAFPNAIINGDNKEILRIYKDKMDTEEEVALLVGQIASVLTLAYHIYTYKMQGLSEGEIAEILKIHPFKVKKSSQLISAKGISKLKFLIFKLAQLDKDIKTGKIDKNIGFDYFILQLVR